MLLQVCLPCLGELSLLFWNDHEEREVILPRWVAVTNRINIDHKFFFS